MNLQVNAPYSSNSCYLVFINFIDYENYPHGVVVVSVLKINKIQETGALFTSLPLTKYHSIFCIGFVFNLILFNKVLNDDKLFLGFSGYIGAVASLGKKHLVPCFLAQKLAY